MKMADLYSVLPSFLRIQRNAPFKQQLNVAVTVGVLLFAMISSLLISWQGSRQIRDTLLRQGEHVARNLAGQSVLALVYSSTDNARDAVNATLSFPDVRRVEILQVDGQPLVARGDPARGLPAPDATARTAYLEAETMDSWRFVAPVLTKGDDSQFEVVESRENLLGFVRVVQSKKTLSRMLIQIFVANLAISLLFAIAFLLVLRRLANRLTQPITALSDVMARAERGESDIRAQLSGPKDIVDMATAFNSMITALQDRERALRESQDSIEFLAYHDTLTQLPNRLLAQDRFRQAMAHADRARTKVALLFLDLDNFKTINDSLGHLVGDELLKEVAMRLIECVRDMDTISRLGGDEFLIVLPMLPDADAIAPVLVKLLGRMVDVFEIDEQELSTSASIGIALYPDDGADFEALLKKSDMAMYRAKESGRNTYRFFDDQMNVEAVEHLRMRNGLRKALGRGEFVLHYQPQIDIASGAMIGAEALIRWHHPEMGMVPPGRFIPIAEDSGLIVPIGEWVLYEACQQAAAWGKSGIHGLVIAVNLSAVQFRRGEIEQSVIRALEESGLNPALLELELTESILINDTEHILATVQRLKRLGVKLSIDDFGTGYSSLSYLKRFQVDKLKIDQSFVRDLATDAEDAAIVRAVIQMAGSLGLTTIAEGVENELVLEFLREFGCDEAQGYHFARPMPAEELLAFRSAIPRTVMDRASLVRNGG